MTQASDWQGGVGRAWAEEWRRTDRTFAELTPRLLASASQFAGRRILDLGCGAGEVALTLAASRPEAEVRGIDISEDLIRSARDRRATDLPAHVSCRFDVADATVWADPDFAPDLIVSRHGVMFFADPPAAFRHLASVSAPHAQLFFSCFRALRENEWATALATAVAPSAAANAASSSAGFPPPGPFALAGPAHIHQALDGWTDITITPHDFTYIAGAGEDAEAQAEALFWRIGPTAAALRLADPVDRPAIERRLRDLISRHHHAGRIGFAAAAWIVTARRA